jgi:hypothetical protein
MARLIQNFMQVLGLAQTSVCSPCLVLLWVVVPQNTKLKVEIGAQEVY